MAKVAEAGQTRPALAEDGGGHAEIEARRGKAIGPFVHEAPDDERAAEGQRGGREQRAPPRQLGDATDQMRRGRAHRERAHQDADGEPAGVAEPRRDDLHGRRIGPGHAQTRGEAEDERGDEALHPQGQRGIQGGAGERAPAHESPRRDDVRKIGERGAERAQDEAGLHGDGEPRASAVPERPLARERGEHGRGAEPEREGAQLGSGKEGEGSPAARGRVGAGQLGQSFFI